MPLTQIEQEVRNQRRLILAAALILGFLVAITGRAAITGAKHDAIRAVIVVARDNCETTTRSRTVGAGRAAADAIREYALSGGAVSAEHHLSAVKSEESARDLLRLSGFPEWRDVRLSQMVAMDPDWLALRRQRTAYCRRSNPLER